MRRAQAILSILALLAVPLALFARGEACRSHAECPYCASHASPADGKRMACSRCAAHAGCGASQSAPDYGVNSPMAPTAPLALAAVPQPSTARHELFAFSSPQATGFASLPFEPPRA